MAPNFYFDLKKTAIYQAVKYEKYYFFRWRSFFKKLFFILTVIVFLVFLFGAITEFLGVSVIFLVLTLFFAYSELFFDTKLKQPKLKTKAEEALVNPQKYNLAEFLSFEAAKAVSQSLKFAKSKKLSGIDSSILFYFLLKDNARLDFIFGRVLLDVKEIRESLKAGFSNINPPQPFTEDFQNTILESLKRAARKKHQRIEIEDIIVALAEHNSFFEEILAERKLKAEDIENLVGWLENIEEKINRRKRFWAYENLMKGGTLAKTWTAGYTITLDRFSNDLTEQIRKILPETVGLEEQEKHLERILSRQEINNVLLVGEPGMGRKSIVYNLTKKSILGQCLPEVNYKRVVELDLPQLMAQLQDQEQVEETLDRIFQEATNAGNIILVIDEFHNYISQTARPGITDISGAISSYLHLPQFQIIAVTTPAGLHQYIEQNPSVLALFEKVKVSEISRQETLTLLGRLTFALERKYKILISYPVLKEIISLSEKYLPALPFPEKALELLDEVTIYVAQNTKDKVVLPKHVAKIITEKTKIPVGEIETKEREVLLNLEELIHQRIINQEEAVKEVSLALRRARAEVQTRKGPMGSFLFLGPTGVGKTETSKALAEFYFGAEERMIRLDMSEFQAIEDIPRLLGSPGQEGLLTTPVRDTPFSLILLDEIEKAHPNILNLFLQVLDEGHLTDGQNRKVDFKNSIIIATSNAGYQIILEALKQKTEWSQVREKILEHLFAQGIFRPEFINRFDAVVVFRPLSKENLLDIAELLLQKLKKNLKEKGVDFIITDALKEKVAELGYEPAFGARQMRRVIQDKVESALAQGILKEELKRGSKVEIDPIDFSLKINV